MSKRIHSLEGREERVRELGNAAHGKQELTCWREGRGRSRLVNSEMWHVANKVPSWGRKREEWVSELRNVARCKTRTHLLEGRKREERVGELGNMACRKKRTHFLEGRKRRSKLVSSETWHAGNEDLLSGGEEERGAG